MKDNTIQEKTMNAVEQNIDVVLKNGVTVNNLDYLYKLVDIHKDMANEKYWKIKEEKLMGYSAYGNYGNYGRYGREAYGEGSYGRRSRDSRGRYSVPEDKIDEMYMNYQAYSEGREAYGRSGNYGAKEDATKCLDKMLESMVDFVKMLKEEASSQEEIELIHKYIKKLSEM